MTISYKWERSCSKWNEPSDNPFRIISFDEADELNAIFSSILNENKRKNIRSDRNKLQKESIEKWANSKKIKIRYYWGCVGKSLTVHKVKCLTVAKNGELFILRATVNCGSDIASENDEDWHLIMRRGIYLIHNHKIPNFKLCKRCSPT